MRGEGERRREGDGFKGFKKSANFEDHCPHRPWKKAEEGNEEGEDEEEEESSEFMKRDKVCTMIVSNISGEGPKRCVGERRSRAAVLCRARLCLRLTSEKMRRETLMSYPCLASLCGRQHFTRAREGDYINALGVAGSGRLGRLRGEFLRWDLHVSQRIRQRRSLSSR